MLCQIPFLLNIHLSRCQKVTFWVRPKTEVGAGAWEGACMNVNKTCKKTLG